MGLFSNEEHAYDPIICYIITCIEITAIQGNSLYQPTPKPHISNHYLLMLSHSLDIPFQPSLTLNTWSPRPTTHFCVCSGVSEVRADSIVGIAEFGSGGCWKYREEEVWGLYSVRRLARVVANQMYEMGRGTRPCTEPMGIPAGNWKLEPARFSETAEQIYWPARCKNAEDCHWSNTRRENLYSY